MRALLAMLGFAVAAAALGAPLRSSARATEQICPSIMQPVCAQGAGGMQTFPNRCLAEGAGFTVVKQGSCEGTTSRRLAQTACTKEYLPVCGEKNGVRKTFGNECEARAARYAIVKEDAC